MWLSARYGSLFKLRRCADSPPANQPADDKSRGGCGDAERGATGVGRDRPRRGTTGARRSLDAIACPLRRDLRIVSRSEEHTSELQSLMRNSYAVFLLNKQTIINIQ